LLKNPDDFFELKKKEEELLKMKGIKKKKIDNIFNAIENSKKKPLANLLNALGIPLLGLVKAQKLITFYTSLSEILKKLEKDEDEIENILGEKSKEELKKFFQKPENERLIKKLNDFWN
jgi:DNA ligase (NAD+)